MRTLNKIVIMKNVQHHWFRCFKNFSYLKHREKKTHLSYDFFLKLISTKIYFLVRVDLPMYHCAPRKTERLTDFRKKYIDRYSDEQRVHFFTKCESHCMQQAVLQYSAMKKKMFWWEVIPVRNSPQYSETAMMTRKIAP